MVRNLVSIFILLRQNPEYRQRCLRLSSKNGLSKLSFWGVSPHLDVDAAVKFVLNAFFLDARLDELACLLTVGYPLGGVRGEPGWILERWEVEDNTPGYSNWPAGVHFRAFVVPDFYELAHPEFYMERKVFQKYVKTALDVYVQENPSAIDDVTNVSNKFVHE